MPSIPFPKVPDLPGVPNIARKLGSNIGVGDVVGALQSGSLKSLLAGALGTTWGVYDISGRLVIEADSVLDVEYRNDSKLSDYPVEQGSFYTYNKVATPYTVSATLIKEYGLPSLSLSSVTSGLSGQALSSTRQTFLQAFDKLLRPPLEEQDVPVVDESELNKPREISEAELQQNIDKMNGVGAKTLSNAFVDVVTPDAVYQSVQLSGYDWSRSAGDGCTVLKVRARFTEVRVADGTGGDRKDGDEPFDLVSKGKALANKVKEGVGKVVDKVKDWAGGLF